MSRSRGRGADRLVAHVADQWSNSEDSSNGEASFDEDEELRAAAREAGAGPVDHDDDNPSTDEANEFEAVASSDEEYLDDLGADLPDEDSEEEWRLSDASDAGSDEGDAGPRPKAGLPQPAQTSHLGRSAGTPQAWTMSDSQPMRQPGGAVDLSPSQLARLGLDNMGSDALRDAAIQRRNRYSRQDDGEDEYEVEEDELRRLLKGYGVVGLTGMGSSESGSAKASSQSQLQLSGVGVDETMDHEGFRNDLDGLSSFKKPQKKMRRALREQALSDEVKRLLSDANVAYVGGDMGTAITKLEEVIKIEPTVRSAWSTLALCFQDKNDTTKELRCRIVEASLTPKATDLWIQLAHQSLDIGDQSQALYCFDQAVKTSQEKDKSDVLDAMWDRSLLLREMGEPRKAITAFNQLLRVRPHNADVLTQLVPLLVDVERRSQAIKLLQQSRAFNQRHFPHPFSEDGLRFSTYHSSEAVTLADLLMQDDQVLGALHSLRQDARWFQGRIKDTFWDEVVDDDREFDESRSEPRSDAPRYGRRVEMAPSYGVLDPQIRIRLGNARHQLGDYTEANRHLQYFFDHTDPGECWNDWLFAIDLYLKDERWEQARSQLEVLTTIDYLDAPILWIKLGICHHALKDLDAAESCFDAVLRSDPSNLDVKMRLAEVYEEQGKREEAMELVQEVLAVHSDSQNPDLNLHVHSSDTRTKLLRLQGAHVTLQDPSDSASAPRRSDPKPQKGRRNKSAMRQEFEKIERKRAEEASRSLLRMKELDSDVFVDGFWRADVSMSILQDAGAGLSQRRYGKDRHISPEWKRKHQEATSEWLELASRLADSFLAASYLYPREGRTKSTKDRKGGRRQRPPLLPRRAQTAADSHMEASQRADDLMARIQDNMLDETVQEEQEDSFARSTALSVLSNLNVFRGIDFDQWARILMQCAFVLTKVGRYSQARKMLEDASAASVFNTAPGDRRKVSLKLCLISCALYQQDYLQIAEAVRHFFYHWQFNNTAIRLQTLLANAVGFYGLDLFAERRLSKLIVRRNRTHESLIAGRKYVISRVERRYVIRGKLQQSKSRKDSKRWITGHLDEDGKIGRKKKTNKDVDEGRSHLPDEDDEGDDEEEEGAEDVLPEEHFVRGPPGSSTAGEETMTGGFEKLPTKFNPLGELHYGYFLLVGGSYQSALAYFLRSYSRLASDPLICLTAACACLGRMTNRQADNRNHLLIQGLSLLDMYRRLRGAKPLRTLSRGMEERRSRQSKGSAGEDVHMSDGQSVASNDAVPSLASMEAAYNFGRGFHTVGLLHLAVPQYEAVLRAHDMRVRQKIHSRADDGLQPGFNPYREAAYNLAVMLTINGNAKGARELFARYLSIGQSSV